MYTNIRQETAVNYSLSPKPWSIRLLELDDSTNYLTSLSQAFPTLETGF